MSTLNLRQFLDQTIDTFGGQACRNYSINSCNTAINQNREKRKISTESKTNDPLTIPKITAFTSIQFQRFFST